MKINIMIFLIMILTLAGCYNSQQEKEDTLKLLASMQKIVNQSNVNNNSDSPVKEAIPPEPPYVEGQLGTLLANNKIELRVNSLDFANQLGTIKLGQSMSTSTCDQATSFMVINLEIKNVGDKEIDMSMIDWSLSYIDPLTDKKVAVISELSKDAMIAIEDGFSLTPLKKSEKRSGNVIFKVGVYETDDLLAKQGFVDTNNNRRVCSYYKSEISEAKQIGLRLRTSGGPYKFTEDIGDFYVSNIFKADYSIIEGKIGEIVAAENFGWEVKVNAIVYETYEQQRGQEKTKRNGLSTATIDLELKNLGIYQKYPPWTRAITVYGLGFMLETAMGETFLSSAEFDINFKETAEKDNPFKVTIINPNEARTGVIVLGDSGSYNPLLSDYDHSLTKSDKCYVIVKDAEWKGIAKISVPCPITE